MGAPAYSTIIAWEPLRTLAYTSMAGTYVGVGTPMANPIRMMSIYNSTNEDLYFSVDGITDYWVIPATSSKIYDIASNKSTQGGWLVLSSGTRIYVRYPGSAPTLGSVFIEVIYGSDAGAS